MRMRHTIYGAGLCAVLLGSTPILAGQEQEHAVIIPASPAKSPQQQEMLVFLHDYFSALAMGEVAKLTTSHPTLTPEQLGTLRDYFTYTIRDLHIQLQDVRVRGAANMATVDFYRTDHFIDQPTDRPVTKSIRLSTTLVQSANGWRLAGLDQVAFALAARQVRPG